LVFDEATSAMDVGAEAALLQRIRAELDGRTFIAITHKSTMLQLATKIIVLDQGRVTAQGTPEELLRAQQQMAAASNATPAGPVQERAP
jgi:ABC-type bacteriocin/lantibiotic exporter with double-glycine peptidase domain